MLSLHYEPILKICDDLFEKMSRQTNKGTCRPNSRQRHSIKFGRLFRLSTYRAALRSRTNTNQQLINKSGKGGNYSRRRQKRLKRAA